MKLQIDREELVQGFGRIQPIVERRGTLPILSHALLQAGKDGVTLAATDLEVGIVSTHPATVEKAGVVTLGARKLFEIARELEDNEVSLVLEEGSRVRLDCGRVHFSLLSVSPDEYPTVQRAEGMSFVEFEPSLLGEMIDRTIFAASTDETRYNLNGVYMELTKEERLRFVATDGHRLAMIDRAPATSVGFLEKGIIVPRKGMAEIRKLCDEAEGLVGVGLGEGFLLVRSSALLISCRLIEGEFPSYKQVIPADFRIRLVVDRERLTHAVRRISLVANERSRAFRFVLEDGQLELSASSPELGEARESLAVDYPGDRFETGFSARYVLDALTALAAKEILLEFADELAPARLRPADDADHTVVVMPMRL